VGVAHFTDREEPRALTARVSALRLDPDYFRFRSRPASSRQAIRLCLVHAPDTILALAEGVACQGAAAFAPIVIAADAEVENRFVVIDGNLRTASVLTLINPWLAEGAMPLSARRELRKLNKHSFRGQLQR